jgi:hypothetical protein
MIVAQALFKILSTNTTLIALVGDRIYPGKLPQDVGGGYTYPAIVFRRVERSSLPILNPGEPGESRGSSGLQENRWRFFSIGLEPTYSVQARLDEAIRLCLEGFQGVVTDETISPVESIEIQGIFPLTSVDFNDDKTATFQVISDYDVWAGEQQPLGA